MAYHLAGNLRHLRSHITSGLRRCLIYMQYISVRVAEAECPHSVHLDNICSFDNLLHKLPVRFFKILNTKQDGRNTGMNFRCELFHKCFIHQHKYRFTRTNRICRTVSGAGPNFDNRKSNSFRSEFPTGFHLLYVKHDLLSILFRSTTCSFIQLSSALDGKSIDDP